MKTNETPTCPCRAPATAQRCACQCQCPPVTATTGCTATQPCQPGCQCCCQD